MVLEKMAACLKYILFVINHNEFSITSIKWNFVDSDQISDMQYIWRLKNG